ncbi:MAG: hypothetical protein FWD34_05270 [Oscillospiraceae bacterium]|nr:hypothetical protein [Oscillospiraceae bacterium]
MNISKVIDQSMINHTNSPKTAQQDTQKKTSALSSDNVDKFDNSSAFYNRNYNSATHQTENFNIQGYKGSTLQMKNALLQDYVNFSVGNQSGGNSTSPFFGFNSFNPTYNPLPFALNAFNAAEATSAKHNDYWSVDAVAERIFTFAKTLAGENDELFNTMKNAFLKGFNQAAGARGGKLPDISHQTKSKVMELFDGWEKEIAAKKSAPVETDKE